MSNIEKQIFRNPLSHTLCIVPSISFGQRNLAILCGCNLELIMARLLATCHLAGNFLGGERRTADFGPACAEVTNSHMSPHTQDEM